jgi:hypothetical protein
MISGAGLASGGLGTLYPAQADPSPDGGSVPGTTHRSYRPSPNIYQPR